MQRESLGPTQDKNNNRELAGLLEKNSDIPVHREQNPARGRYFLPDDAKALTALLWTVWCEPGSDEMQMMESARRTTDERRLEFAENYQKIVFNTLERHS